MRFLGGVHRTFERCEMTSVLTLLSATMDVN
jgi:hypothetical protein